MHQISCESDFRWPSSDVVQFSRWRRSAMLYFLCDSGWPPTTWRWWYEFCHQILGWSDVWCRRYCSFFRFWQLGLKMWGFWEHFPQMMPLIILIPKGLCLGWTTSFEPQSVSAVRFELSIGTRKKGSRGQDRSTKGYKMVIFHPFGEKLLLERATWKIVYLVTCST